MKRKISKIEGLSLVQLFAAGKHLSSADMKTAVRFTLEEFAERYPGRAVEIRIPWIGAVQAIAGVNHRRGTPPNLVEMDGATWLSLITGRLLWNSAESASSSESISFSGTRADLSPYFPLFFFENTAAKQKTLH